MKKRVVTINKKVLVEGPESELKSYETLVVNDGGRITLKSIVDGVLSVISHGAYEAKTVSDLAFTAEGTSASVTPTSGKDAMTKVTITKPDTLKPENIKKDVVIFGITGTYEAA